MLQRVLWVLGAGLSGVLSTAAVSKGLLLLHDCRRKAMTFTIEIDG